MTHPFFVRTRRPAVLAHRGLVLAAGEDSPVQENTVWENTAAAFAAAHAAGADYIETDCRVTADGDVVLFHDATLRRLLSDDRPVQSVRTAELTERFAAHGGLLTVSEMLEMFPETRFNIDVKTDAAVAPLGSIIAPHTQRVLLTSFDDTRRTRVLKAVADAGAKLRPATSAGRSITSRARLLSALRLASGGVLRSIDALQIPERHGVLKVLTPALLKAAHHHGVQVHVWTVNEVHDMHRLIEFGVDGVVTDRADVALKAFS